MDAANYRTVKTQRGYTYSYYYRQADKGKPTLLFIHGCPSTSKDWASQVTHFGGKGYGLIVPDLLGYGGSSSPKEAQPYTFSGFTDDLNDVVQDVGVAKVVAIGHDWGSAIISRLWNVHPEKISAIAFVSAGYAPPTPPGTDPAAGYAAYTQAAGYDTFGYQEFFVQPDAAELITKNIDSFYSIIFPLDHTLWKTDLAVKGKLREWLEQNKQGPLPSYWDEAAKKEHQQNLLKGGLVGPLLYYVALHSGLSLEADSKITLDKYPITVPTFFAAAKKDAICVPAAARLGMSSQLAPNLTEKEFDTGHWIMFEQPDALNKELEEWLEGVVA